MLFGAGLSLVGASCAGTSTQQIATDAAPSTTTIASTTTTTRPPDCASTLPTSAQAAELLMVMVPDPTNAADELANGLVGGFGLKGNQRSDVDEALAEVTADLPLPATVAVDEEGGTVQRLRFSAGRLASAEEMGQGTSAEAATAFGEHSGTMEALGVTMNFAPVADTGEGADLASRTFGDDPTVVADFVTALVGASTAAGITPVVKHWPGIGGATEDPHEELPTLAPIDDLRTSDLIPFEAAIDAGAPAVMVAHAEVPGLTEQGEPASLSAAAIDGELRGNEGFDGVVITDSLGMGAVVNEMTQAEAAEQAIAAGADIALLSGTEVVADAHARLVDAIDEGRIPAARVEESVRRVLEMRGVQGECFDAVSAFAARARLEAESSESPASGGVTDTSTLSDGSDAKDESINDPG